MSVAAAGGGGSAVPVGVNPDNNLGYVCWNHLPSSPDHLHECFRHLFKTSGPGSGGIVLYYFALVDKIGRKILPQERVLFVSHSAIYQCMTTSEVNRCVRIRDVSEIFTTHDHWVGIKMKQPEYDLLFKFKETSSDSQGSGKARFLEVVSVLYKELTGGNLKVTDAHKQPIKARLNLKKPKGWQLRVENFVRRKDLWRAQFRRERSKRADESGTGGDAPPAGNDAFPRLLEESIDVDVEHLEDPTTRSLMKPAAPEDSTPYGTPTSSPRQDPASPQRSPSRSANDTVPLLPKISTPLPHTASGESGQHAANPMNTSTGSTSSAETARRVAPHDGREGSTPTGTPQQQHHQTNHPFGASYRLGETLQVRRSTGLWEDCVVQLVEPRDPSGSDGFYVVEVVASREKKQIFFSEEQAYLRPIPRDADGTPIDVSDCVVLLESIVVDGECLPEGGHAVVLTIPGVEEGTVASVTHDGTIADVKASQFRRIDQLRCDTNRREVVEGDRVVLQHAKKIDDTDYTVQQFAKGSVLTVPGDDPKSVASVFFDGSPESVDVYQDEIRVIDIEEEEASMPLPGRGDVEEELPGSPPHTDRGLSRSPSCRSASGSGLPPTQGTQGHRDANGRSLALHDTVAVAVDCLALPPGGLALRKGAEGLVVQLMPNGVLSLEMCEDGEFADVDSSLVTARGGGGAEAAVDRGGAAASGEEPSPPPPPPPSSTQLGLEAPALPHQLPVADSLFGREVEPDALGESVGVAAGVGGVPSGSGDRFDTSLHSSLSTSVVTDQGNPKRYSTDLPSSAPTTAPLQQMSDHDLSAEESRALTKLLSSGDFAGLGAFVHTLCGEYRTRIAELKSEVKEKNNECLRLHSVIADCEDRFRSTRGDHSDRDDAYSLSASHHRVAELEAELALKDHALAEMRARNADTRHVIEQTAPRTPPTPPTGGADRRDMMLHQLEETVSFLKGRVAEVEGERVTLRTRLEEKEEQVLSLQIDNESKEMDTLLLREAVVLAERRCDQFESAINSGLMKASTEVVNMSPAALHTFLSEHPPLPVSTETANLLHSRGISGSSLMALLEEAAQTTRDTSPGLELVSAIRSVQESDYSSLCHILGVSVARVGREEGKGANHVFDQIVDSHLAGGQHSSHREMQELTKVAWIISSRSRLVEDIYRGYQTVKMVHSMVGSSVRTLRLNPASEEVVGRLHDALEHMSRVEQLFKRVVSNYFMDFEKLHLGIVGHKNERASARSRSGSAGRTRSGSASGRARSRSPNSGITALESKLSLTLTPTERRVLVKLATTLYRCSHVKVRVGDGAVYHSLPPAALSGRAATVSRSPVRGGSPVETAPRRAVSPCMSSVASPSLASVVAPRAEKAAAGKGFEQILYLTPPSGTPVAVSSDVSEYCSPQRTSTPTDKRRGRKRPKDVTAVRRVHSPTAFNSPASSMGRPRPPSPIVAFGRSALPRAESPVRRNSPRSRIAAHRSGSSGRSSTLASSQSSIGHTLSGESRATGTRTHNGGVASPLGRRQGSRAAASSRASDNTDAPQSRRSAREPSISADSLAESVPLSAWATDLKPTHHPFFPMGHT